MANVADGIEAQTDPASDGGDSGYDEKTFSTASVTSSIYDYEVSHGRTYHAFHAGKYLIPNDDGEQERMDLHYHTLRLVMADRLFLAPLEHPTSVLDVGTGSGVWAMDLADTYPGASVVGTDLSPIQPTLVPPNLQFEICDLEEPWDTPQRYDLVHTRLMNGFSVKDWPKFYREAFESSKAGGWVENQEFDLNVCCSDGSLPPGSKIKEWETLWNQGIERWGGTGRCDGHRMAQQMLYAGYTNVQVCEYKMPHAPWPKDRRLREAGLYNMIAMHEALQGLSVKVFTQCLGWSVEETELLLTQVRQEWKRKRIHIWFPVYIVYGQKPPESKALP